jgi:hypothetical protein
MNTRQTQRSEESVILSLAILVVHYVVAHYADKPTDYWWGPLLMLLVTPMAIFPMRWQREKALAKEFAENYAKHKISHYPLWSRQTYFTYTLFLDELRDQKWSHEKAARLSSFAEIATPPEGPQFRLSQHFLITTSMAVLIGLSMEFIKRSDLFKDKHGLLILPFSVMILWIIIAGISLGHYIVNRSKYRHQTIQRYLQWAEKDLKEEQLFLQG